MVTWPQNFASEWRRRTVPSIASEQTSTRTRSCTWPSALPFSNHACSLCSSGMQGPGKPCDPVNTATFFWCLSQASSSASHPGLPHWEDPDLEWSPSMCQTSALAICWPTEVAKGQLLWQIFAYWYWSPLGTSCRWGSMDFHDQGGLGLVLQQCPKPGFSSTTYLARRTPVLAGPHFQPAWNLERPFKKCPKASPTSTRCSAWTRCLLWVATPTVSRGWPPTCRELSRTGNASWGLHLHAMWHFISEPNSLGHTLIPGTSETRSWALCGGPSQLRPLWPCFLEPLQALPPPPYQQAVFSSTANKRNLCWSVAWSRQHRMEPGGAVHSVPLPSFSRTSTPSWSSSTRRTPDSVGAWGWFAAWSHGDWIHRHYGLHPCGLHRDFLGGAQISSPTTSSLHWGDRQRPLNLAHHDSPWSSPSSTTSTTCNLPALAGPCHSCIPIWVDMPRPHGQERPEAGPLAPRGLPRAHPGGALEAHPESYVWSLGIPAGFPAPLQRKKAIRGHPGHPWADDLAGLYLDSQSPEFGHSFGPHLGWCSQYHHTGILDPAIEVRRHSWSTRRLRGLSYIVPESGYSPRGPEDKVAFRGRGMAPLPACVAFSTHREISALTAHVANSCWITSFSG